MYLNLNDMYTVVCFMLIRLSKSSPNYIFVKFQTIGLNTVTLFALYFIEYGGSSYAADVIWS